MHADTSHALLDRIAGALAHADAALRADAEHALERVRALLASRQEPAGSESRLVEELVDALPVGVYVIDREYRIRLWNRKRETGTQGVAREEAIGRNVFEVLHRQPAERLRAEFDEVFATGVMRQYDVESTASGETRFYRISKIPMRVGGGDAVTHVLTLGEDLTEQRRARDRIMQAEKLAAVGQLAAGVMHEMNNPLATIGACAESLEGRLERETLPDALRDEVREYLRILEHEVGRCTRIASELLRFSRRGDTERTPVDLHVVLEETLHLLHYHARFRRVRVEREFAAQEGGLVVRGRAEHLVQLFMALLINAADAMPDGGRVWVRTVTRPGPPPEAVVEIRDEGGGIEQRELRRIFEPFFTTKPPGQGTGLGLSICYGIAEDHGGRIDVESVRGAGSTFRVILPQETAECATMPESRS
ncbi:MAG TPA: ATP-binding protein [Gemmatimonadaceae bacterium]|nr:ATP-binding protein [Gemmatimonadaceae bacterium]